MHTIMTRHLGRVSVLLLAAVLVLTAAVGARPAAAAPSLATLPASTCTLDGTTRTCDLWAKTGTLSLPGGVTVPFWGYSDTALGAATLPGPTIIANQGETLVVNLHNSLAEVSALSFPGQTMVPDLTGVAGGATGPYTIALANPGTYLYEAGLTANGRHQVALGMFGALIVRPTGLPLQAYGSASTAFVDEALVVLSEVDPAFNSFATPATFDMRNWAPKYWLINGKAYPQTDPIPALAGDTVLLRYINAGLQQHSMGLLGLEQKLIARDGSPSTYPFKVVAQTIGPGETFDALVSVPAVPPVGTTSYLLYDTSLRLHNNSARAAVGAPVSFGGMMSVISLGAGGPPTPAPTTSGVALNPNPASGTGSVLLTATVADTAVTGAEYFIDAPGAAGAGTAMTAVDGSFGGATEAVQATLSSGVLAGLSAGTHNIYVHGFDGTTWGAFAFAALNLDKVGPATTALTLTPNPSKGAADVTLRGTADDMMTGGSAIMMAEYTIDGGPAATMNVANNMMGMSEISAVIPAATVGALAQGTHVVSVRSQDALGWWGVPTTINLLIDKSGPTTSGVLVRPSPNNGTVPFNSTFNLVRVDATINDLPAAGVNSNVATAEGVIDNAAALPGSGFPFIAVDGMFNSSSEAAYGTIPLATVALLTEGNHTVYVRGLDSSGNWGSLASGTLRIDKTRPTVAAVQAAPNPTGGAASFTLTATATDAGAGVTTIAAAEYFRNPDPGNGNATPMQAADGTFNGASENLTALVPLAGWPMGPNTVYVRAKDAAGNWSLLGSVVVTVQPANLIFSDGFEAGNFNAWSLTTGVAVGTGAGISVQPGAAMGGSTLGMRARITGNTPGYVTDNTPVNETSYFGGFWFHPNGTVTGGTQHTILVGRSAVPQNIFGIQYRRTGGGTYQLRAWIQTSGGQVFSGWQTITNAAHRVRLDWQSANAATARFFIDGAQVGTLAGNTSAFTLDAVRLGPSAGLTGGTSGNEYFDGYVSSRASYIGP